VGTWGGVRANEKPKTGGFSFFVFRSSFFPRGGGHPRKNAKNATAGSRENALKGK